MQGIDEKETNIKTSCAYSRLWTKSDLPLAQALWGNPKVTKFVTKGGGYSESEIRARFQAEMFGQAADGISYWPFFKTTMEGDDEASRFIGVCGLRPLQKGKQSADGKELELGVHLLPQYWRQGLGKQVTVAVLHWAFSTGGCSAVFAGHHPENKASAAFLQSFGFVSGDPELYPPTGLMHNSYWLKRDEWLTQCLSLSETKESKPTEGEKQKASTEEEKVEVEAQKEDSRKRQEPASETEPEPQPEAQAQVEKELPKFQRSEKVRKLQKRDDLIFGSSNWTNRFHAKGCPCCD